MQYRLWQVVSVVVRRLPRRAGYFAAVVGGNAAYHLWPRGRRVMQRNFGRVLPEASQSEVRKVARRSLVNYCKYLIDFMRFPSASPSDLIESVHGRESFRQLDEALGDGRGVVFACAHFGNWDLAAGAVAARGYPVSVVAESFGDPRLDRMVAGARRRLGMNVIKMERAGPSLLRALKNNGLLALLIDRNAAGDGVSVSFFGEQVEVPAGPARLALRSGASVVPAAFARIHPFRPAVSVLADFSINVASTGDSDADVQQLTQAIMSAHEGFIRQHPEQWYMFRDLWANGHPARRPA